MKRSFTWRVVFILTVLMFSIFPSDFSFGLQGNVVHQVEAASTEYQTTANLNMRTGASTKHKTITTIPKGKKVTYVSKSGSWYKVKYGNKTGFSSSKYLKKATTVSKKAAAKQTVKKANSSSQYQTTANLNMRTGASTKHKTITTIPKGKKVTYVSKSGSWYKVKYGNKTGFASSKYLKVTSATTTAKKTTTVKTPAPKKTTTVKKEVAKKSTTVQYQTTANLNMRTGASTKHKVVTTIPKGKKVTYVSKSGSWYKVKYGNRTGFTSSKYLKKASESSTVKKPTTNKSPVAAPVKKGYKVPTLMYHAIAEYKGSGIKELYVTPKNFEAQMRYLKSAGFTPITFDDMKNVHKFKKPILITFDDGYKNNMNAYNILKDLNDSKWKAKGVIFMIGKKIDTPGGLSTKQLKTISDSGIISVQSHTETHPSLTKTKNYNLELRDIKTKLEKITGKKVTAIAYPIGHYDSKVIAETKKHYSYAVTTKPGVANTSESLYEMKRVRVSYSTSLDSFKRMVNQ